MDITFAPARIANAQDVVALDVDEARAAVGDLDALAEVDFVRVLDVARYGATLRLTVRGTHTASATPYRVDLDLDADLAFAESDAFGFDED